jgi:hypothetical protein
LPAGAPPSLDGICASGTKPVAHVLQQDLTGGANGVTFQCVGGDGTGLKDSGQTGSACLSEGEWYANAYTACALDGEELGAFRTIGTCDIPAPNCSMVVTCCPS